MPRKSQIKWRESDKKALSQAVRNFNAKRTRLIKQVPELADILPKKQNVGELRNLVYNRSDYNKILNRLKRFMVKGATDVITTKEGVVTTKYQVRELNINKSIINRKRAQLRKKANVSTEKGTMGAIEKMNLRPKKLDPNKIRKSMWDEVVQNFERQSLESYYNDRDDLYKQNYLKAFTDAFGGLDTDNLYDVIDSLPSSTVIEMFYYDPNLQIDFLYPIDEEDAINNYQFYKDTLINYLEEMGV